MTTEMAKEAVSEDGRYASAKRYLAKMAEFMATRAKAEKRLEEKRSGAAVWVTAGMRVHERIDAAGVLSALNERLAREADRAYGKAWTGIVENAKALYGGDAVRQAFDELGLSDSEKFFFGTGRTLAHGIQLRVVAT